MRAAPPGRLSPLHPAAGHGARVRLDQRLDRRVGDRDIERFSSPAKLVSYTGLCPRVLQSGSTDRRGPISNHSPRYLRWGLFEAAMNACEHPLYAERYQHTKRRVGRQRGPKIAQIELSRKLIEAIWHMLTRDQPFAPAGTGVRLAA